MRSDWHGIHVQRMKLNNSSLWFLLFVLFVFFSLSIKPGLLLLVCLLILATFRLFCRVFCRVHLYFVWQQRRALWLCEVTEQLMCATEFIQMSCRDGATLHLMPALKCFFLTTWKMLKAVNWACFCCCFILQVVLKFHFVYGV